MRTYSIMRHDSGMYYIILREPDGTQRVANEIGEPDLRIVEPPSPTMQPTSPGHWPQGYSQFTGASRVCNRLNREAERYELWGITASLAWALRAAVITCPWCGLPLQQQQDGQQEGQQEEHVRNCPLVRLSWLQRWAGMTIQQPSEGSEAGEGEAGAK